MRKTDVDYVKAKLLFNLYDQPYLLLLFQYDSVLKAFCEDSKQIQPDVFFGIFDTFLASFGDAKTENDKLKKQKEEEEKRKKIEEQVREWAAGYDNTCQHPLQLWSLKHYDSGVDNNACT